MRRSACRAMHARVVRQKRFRGHTSEQVRRMCYYCRPPFNVAACRRTHYSVSRDAVTLPTTSRHVIFIVLQYLMCRLRPGFQPSGGTISWFPSPSRSTPLNQARSGARGQKEVAHFEIKTTHPATATLTFVTDNYQNCCRKTVLRSTRDIASYVSVSCCPLVV